VSDSARPESRKICMASGPDTGAMTLTWKQRVMRGEPYNPSKLSPKEK